MREDETKEREGEGEGIRGREVGGRREVRREGEGEGTQGRRIQSRDKFSDGGNLEEPVPAGLLPRVRDLVWGELLWQHYRLAGTRREVRALPSDAIIHQVTCGEGGGRRKVRSGVSSSEPH